MSTKRLSRRTIIVLVLGVVVGAFVFFWVGMVRGKLSLERLREKYQSRQALICYVQLKYQCTEEAAYRYITNFLKKQVPLEEFPYVEYMAVHARQSLLARAQEIFQEDPDKIDEV
jgi:hypothetical protein